MKFSQILAAVVASFLLSACGGGGGSGTPAAVAPAAERVGNVPAAVSILPSNAQ
jgi:cell division GTPase FtsZ